MKKLMLIMGSALILITGCSKQHSLTIKDVEPNEMNGPVRHWLISKSGDNGFYLGRSSTEDLIYLYANFKKQHNNQQVELSTLDIQNRSGKLVIKASIASADQPYEKLFIISDKKSQPIELNGLEYQPEQVEEIE